MATMRVVRADEAGGPEVLTVHQVERPEPGAHEVLIKVAAAGINRGDVLQRLGHYPPPPGVTDVLGLEVSGTVAAVGDAVRDWQVDDECVALLAGGGYAEYVAVDERQIMRCPKGMDLETAGGFVEVAATVVSNLERARLGKGETLLVHGGAGGIGSFAIQYAKYLGARVVTTAGKPEKLEFCRELGADLALDYHDDWADAVKEFGGVDVVLDSIGAKYLPLHLDLMSPGGRMVTIGMMKGRKGELDLGLLLAKRCTVMGTTLRSRSSEYKGGVLARVDDVCHEGYANGTFRAVPVRSWPLDEAAAAHEFFDSGDHIGKLVLRP